MDDCAEMKKNILRVAESTTLEAVDQGAHITSWQVDGEEQLYISPLCAFEAKKAVRGGIPLIFPQFEKFGDGVRHGFARTAGWVQAPDPEALHYSLKTKKDEYSYWPYSAELNYTARPAENALMLELAVTNPDSRVFSFTCALHTYIKIDALANIRLYGLKGLDYWIHGDACDDRAVEAADYLIVKGKIDRMYFNTSETLLLQDGARQLEFTS
jgi:glucose-6-phosphate 1-epimerase